MDKREWFLMLFGLIASCSVLVLRPPATWIIPVTSTFALLLLFVMLTRRWSIASRRVLLWAGELLFFVAAGVCTIKSNGGWSLILLQAGAVVMSGRVAISLVSIAMHSPGWVFRRYQAREPVIWEWDPSDEKVAVYVRVFGTLYRRVGKEGADPGRKYAKSTREDPRTVGGGRDQHLALRGL